ncbi:autoinducer 2 ABC transporter substrate-binding protein [Cohnella herbarum]|nr:autoinducer 2 ABC transporter substrate-binding protein [Cohnella herbarum]
MYRTIAAFLMIALLMTSCGSGSETRYELVYSMEPVGSASQPPEEPNVPAKRYKIALVPKGIEIDYFKYAAIGAKEAGKSLGIDVLFRGPATADADLQIDIVEQLIDQKVDLIAISANDPVKLVPVLQKARIRGIKVITWDADTEPEGREFFVNMVDPEVLGRHLLDTLALTMGEKGNYAIMTGSFSAANLNEWLRWINIQQREYYPDMKLVATVATDDDQDKAYDVANRLLVDYPDLGGILGNSSVGPPAAARAVKQAGKSGAVKVVGLSSPNLMNGYLREGSAQIATLWSPKKLGFLTIMLAYRYLNGQMPVDGQEIEGVGNIRLNGDMVIMGEPLDFTAENVSQYDF